ncbi:hypothetical protein LCGC14_0479570 [marine sediment metagenome]|uniref:Uncharacterized protein n=1 Tax=marine sediment metagenome TaxID=412755 RepID=A0A0F9UWS3_9ZZZZ
MRPRIIFGTISLITMGLIAFLIGGIPAMIGICFGLGFAVIVESGEFN